MPFPKAEIEFSRIAFEASAISYCNKERITKWCYKNNQALQVFEKDECFAFISWGDNKIIVAYRGTNDIKDWLRNADGRKVQIRDYVKVHKGFYDYMMKVGEDLNEVLRELLSQKVTKNYEIILTGHSLGAAAITVFIDEWFQAKAAPEKTHIHTIGSPRVGCSRFRDQVFSVYPNWYRWVNNSDAIPHLPFAIPKVIRTIGGFTSRPFAYFMPGGFRHVGNVCWLDVCQNLRYKPNLFFQWKDIFQGWVDHIGKRGLAIVHDHFMHDYVLARDRAFYKEEK